MNILYCLTQDPRWFSKETNHFPLPSIFNVSIERSLLCPTDIEFSPKGGNEANTSLGFRQWTNEISYKDSDLAAQTEGSSYFPPGKLTSCCCNSFSKSKTWRKKWSSSGRSWRRVALTRPWSLRRCEKRARCDKNKVGPGTAVRQAFGSVVSANSLPPQRPHVVDTGINPSLQSRKLRLTEVLYLRYSSRGKIWTQVCLPPTLLCV